MIKAQEHQAKHYNKRHTPIQFKRGQLVKLSIRNWKLKDKKLAPRWVGPFRIIEVIGSQAYRLALPEQYSRLHDVFPIQLLERYHPKDNDDLIPMLKLEDEDEECEVEKVKDKQIKAGHVRYLVKWLDWPSEYNQWVPEADMANAAGKIRSFKRSRKWKRQD
jgi:hypothetical protein